MLSLIRWVEHHTPALKALFLLLWLVIAVFCGAATLVLMFYRRPAFGGIMGTFLSVMMFMFFRSLFQFID